MSAMGENGGPGGMERRGSSGGSGQMMGGVPLSSSRLPMFNGELPFDGHRMLGPRRSRSPRIKYGMISPDQDRFTGAKRPGGPVSRGLGIQSPAFRPDIIDIHAIDRPRMPYGPFQGSPVQMYSRYPKYRPPYVENYKNSMMDAEMAQQASMQQQMMMHGANASPYKIDEAQYGGGYGRIVKPMMGGGMGGLMPAMGGGMMGGMR